MGIPSIERRQGREDMGKFEDLIQRVKDGDADAIEELERDFSGSNLREQQEAATAALKENDPYIRVGKFEALTKQAGISNLTLDDLTGTDTQDLSEDLLREKAEAKQAQVNALKAEQATAAGYDSVEEFDKAMEALKQSNATKSQQMQALGGAVASSSGGTPVPEPTEEPYDAALRDFNMAKKTGATHDVAMGEAVHTLMAHQHPVEEVAS
jgi:hypothetical protein